MFEANVILYRAVVDTQFRSFNMNFSHIETNRQIACVSWGSQPIQLEFYNNRLLYHFTQLL